MKPKVKFTNVTKQYSLLQKKSDRLLDVFSLKKEEKNFYALKGVSFEVFEGETIGVVGINGSGKSTLSNLLSQVIPPTTGNVEIHGETSLVAISAGLNNHLTGIENIELKCLMHGLKKHEIETITPLIIDFADIGKFIDQPLKSYSSGMKSRLGFAISVHINPDILIIDEALSVGDQTFYQKCVNKFNEFKEQGKTIFFISHSQSQIRSISDKVLWLNFGKIKEFGETSAVLSNYDKFIKWFNNLSEKEKKEHRNSMLDSQMAIEDTNDNNVIGRRSKIKKKELRLSKVKRNYFYLGIQALFLLFFLLASGLLMFLDKPEALIKNQVSSLFGNKHGVHTDHSDKSQDNTINKVKTINVNGLVMNDNVSVYSDKNKSNKVMALPFGSEIFVEEEENDISKVLIDGEIRFVDSTDVYIQKEDFTIADFTLEEILPIFPEHFVNSYYYILAHLEMGYDEVRNKIRGLTGEYSDQFGHKILEYNSENIAYQFNESDIADTLIIDNIDVNGEVSEELMNSALCVSKDENLYLVFINNYKMILNKKEQTVSLEILK